MFYNHHIESSLVPRLCVWFSVLQATENWAGSGNEATLNQHSKDSHAIVVTLTTLYSSDISIHNQVWLCTNKALRQGGSLELPPLALKKIHRQAKCSTVSKCFTSLAAIENRRCPNEFGCSYDPVCSWRTSGWTPSPARAIVVQVRRRDELEDASKYTCVNKSSSQAVLLVSHRQQWKTCSS